jgi:hypothetical protein
MCVLDIHEFALDVLNNRWGAVFLSSSLGTGDGILNVLVGVSPVPHRPSQHKHTF